MKSMRMATAASTALLAAAAAIFAATTANAGFSLPGPFPSATALPEPSSPASSPSPAIDLCEGVAEPDEECAILWMLPYGPFSDVGEGEAGPGHPLPTGPCPVPLPEPPSPNPMSVVDIYLLCGAPIPTATATVLPVAAHRAGGMTRVAALQDDEEGKYIGTMNMAIVGSKRGEIVTYKTAELIVEAKEGVKEFHGVVVVDLVTTTPGGVVTTQKVRFTTFSKRGKFKDSTNGKEVDGFQAKADLAQQLALPVGTKVEKQVKGIVGAVLLKDESEDRPVKFKKSEKAENTVK